MKLTVACIVVIRVLTYRVGAVCGSLGQILAAAAQCVGARLVYRFSLWNGHRTILEVIISDLTT